MRKYDPLWQDINTLLTFLRNGGFDVEKLYAEKFNAVKLTDEYFLHRYGNSAPGDLLKRQIDKLQKQLDEAPSGEEDS